MSRIATAHRPDIDPAADFDEFYREYFPRVLMLVTKCFHGCDAEDVAQETLTRCYAHFGALDGRDPWPWVSTIARNIARDAGRRSGRVMLGEPHPAFDGDGDGSRPDDIVCERERRRVLDAALRRLRPRDRQLIELHDLDGLSSAEIAVRREVTPTALRQQLHRAHGRLAAEFRKLGGPLGLTGGWSVLRGLLRLRRREAIAATGSASPVLLAVTSAIVAGVAGGAAIGSGVLDRGAGGTAGAAPPVTATGRTVASVRDLAGRERDPAPADRQAPAAPGRQTTDPPGPRPYQFEADAGVAKIETTEDPNGNTSQSVVVGPQEVFREGESYPGYRAVCGYLPAAGGSWWMPSCPK